ncbi:MULTISPECIES: hypothetical protein [unclassified Chromohalobacter]|uniref:hypothetical protein n=1 Tax=unclassified Chromohalobacter TaxID=2628571 RepID=UPI002468F975|nr:MULTISPECIES: hypothetical protein [unclassified Chromohalobacter]
MLRALITEEASAIDTTTFTYLDRLERYPDGYDCVRLDKPAFTGNVRRMPPPNNDECTLRRGRP